MTSRANMNKNNRAYYQRHKEEILARRKAKREENKKYKDQLAQAKEIIRQFLNDYPIITKEVLDKLEQFIKEIEK